MAGYSTHRNGLHGQLLLISLGLIQGVLRRLINGEAYHKISKISPGAYIFQRPFLRGLFLEGLIYRGKFVFQNRLC